MASISCSIDSVLFRTYLRPTLGRKQNTKITSITHGSLSLFSYIFDMCEDNESIVLISSCFIYAWIRWRQWEALKAIFAEILLNNIGVFVLVFSKEEHSYFSMQRWTGRSRVIRFKHSGCMQPTKLLARFVEGSMRMQLPYLSFYSVYKMKKMK